MKTIFSDNPSQDIIEEYAMGEILEKSLDSSRKNYNSELLTIRTIYGTRNKVNTILKYASSEMKKHYEKQREGAKRFDYDSITYKDRNADVLQLICENINEEDETKKEFIISRIMDRIEKNIYEYFETEFNEKVEQAKSDYHQHWGELSNGYWTNR